MTKRKTFEQYISDTLLGVAILLSLVGVLVLLQNAVAGAITFAVAFCLFVLASLTTIVRNTSKRD